MSTEMMQDAFRVSREEFTSGYSEIKQLVDAGRHVVVQRCVAYCPRTDGLMGFRYTALLDAATRAEATMKLSEHLAGIDWEDRDPECDYYVLPGELDTGPIASVPDDDAFEDLPF